MCQCILCKLLWNPWRSQSAINSNIKKKELIVSIDKHLIKAYKKSSCLHAHDSLSDFYHFMIKSPKKHMPVTN